MTHQPPSIRQLPESDPRIETGPLQFGSDSPGVFIRGDNALNYAHHLCILLNTAPPTTVITLAVLRGLLTTLDSCNLTSQKT